jgi:hypothetical protein
LVAIAILFSLGASAAAEDKLIVDMSRMTCRELTKLGACYRHDVPMEVREIARVG